MQCLRCGKETVSERVFCEDCREEMKKYPVNPNIRVSLPKRTTSPAQKKAFRKKTVSAEEQLPVLKSRMRFLWIVLISVSIVALLLAYPAFRFLQEDHFLPGQNYSSMVSVTSETETTTSE